MTTQTPPQTTTPGPALAAESVSRWYGNVVAVNDISFALAPGITGLLGPNGAGKSTMLHMLAGLLKPSSGDVRVLGESTWQNPDIYRRIGLVPEREAVYPFLSGLDFVLLSARLHGLTDPDAAAKRAIEDVELTDAQNRPAGTYSKGMKQRVKVAAAIVHRPPVLLLDEPFNGADPRQRLRMGEMFQRMAADGTTVLFSSHILEEVEQLAENVLVMVAGRLAAAGPFQEIRRLMTDRPHTLTMRSSDNRSLAAELIRQPSISGVEVDSERIVVRSSDLAGFSRLVPQVAQRLDITLFELAATDESLESVFTYLVGRVTGFIFTLTLRQLLGRRSTLIPAGLCLLPVLVSVIFRLSDPAVNPERWTARILMLGFIVTAILPLCVLPLATSVLGDELEEGTLVYLLTKPLARWQILLPKLAAAALVSASMVLGTTLLSGYVALNGRGDLSIVWGFGVGVLIGDIAYTCLFVLLSLVTTRALIAGLVYVFVWEAVVTGIFTGTRYLSIRHYTLGIATWVGHIQPDVYTAQVSGKLALGLILATIVAAVFFANRRLKRTEVREPT